MDEDGRTPLAWAAAEGQVNTVKALLRHPSVMIDARDRARWTPLWYATNNTNLEVMEYLVKAGADHNLRDKDGISLVERVASLGTAAAMRWLLKLPVDIDRVNLALIEAAYQGRVIIMQLLIEAGASVKFQRSSGITAIQAAIKDGHDQAVQMLLDTGQINFDPDSHSLQQQGGDLLIYALNRKNPVLGDHTNSEVNVAGYLPIIRLLIATGRMDLEAALREAASQGDDTVVELLLKSGALDINARTPRRQATALYNASKKGHKTVVEALLRSDAIDISVAANFPRLGKYATGDYFETPLQAADKYGHDEVVAMLRQYSRQKKKKQAVRKWFGSS